MEVVPPKSAATTGWTGRAYQFSLSQWTPVVQEGSCERQEAAANAVERVTHPVPRTTHVHAPIFDGYRDNREVSDGYD